MTDIQHGQVSIELFDTTLRDGAQALPEAHQFPRGTKPEIADFIARLGITTIEAGFPATPGDAEEVTAVARSVGRQPYVVQQWHNQNGEHEEVIAVPAIAGLSRANRSDIEATWSAISDAQHPTIHTFISTDTEHMRAKFPGKSPEEVLAMGRDAVRFARELSAGSNARVEFSAEAASTTTSDYLERVVRDAIAAGADVVNLPDTVGQRDPEFMREFYTRAIRWAHTENPRVIISAHNHNDLGVAVANTHQLVAAAARYAHEHSAHVHVQAEGTINGLGERAGNADIIAFAGGVFKFSSERAVPIEWQFNPRMSVTVARAVARFAGIAVDPSSPIVGTDTYVHRSGIHSDGVIKGGPRIYTPHDPTFWGHTEDVRIEDGRYQGRRGRAVVAAAANA